MDDQEEEQVGVLEEEEAKLRAEAEVAVAKERLQEGVVEEPREQHVNLAEPKINI
jgi:hypothetical protein